MPFPYFHAVKVMLMATLILVGYSLINLLEDSPPLFTIVCFCIFSVIQLGLQEIAAAMSDPFGDDDIDFDIEGLLSSAYNNAISFLREEKPECADTVPDEIVNVLTTKSLSRWRKPVEPNTDPSRNRRPSAFFTRSKVSSTDLTGISSGKEKYSGEMV